MTNKAANAMRSNRRGKAPDAQYSRYLQDRDIRRSKSNFINPTIQPWLPQLQPEPRASLESPLIWEFSTFYSISTVHGQGYGTPSLLDGVRREQGEQVAGGDGCIGG